MLLEVLKSVTKKEMLKSVALARGRHIEALVVELPRGMLTADATEGLEGSDEKGNVKVGDRASLSITKCCVPGLTAFYRRRFDSEPL